LGLVNFRLPSAFGFLRVKLFYTKIHNSLIFPPRTAQLGLDCRSTSLLSASQLLPRYLSRVNHAEVTHSSCWTTGSSFL